MSAKPRADIFLDTNILLYAVSTDPDERHKQAVARQCMAASNWGLSVQVLQEFYVNATRSKNRLRQAAMTPEQAGVAVQKLLAFPTVSNTPDLLLHALSLQADHVVSFWDACVLAAAHAIGATQLYSEDLNAGQRYGLVTVINPFVAAAPGS
jgi:predicted nucleic acid-binding protein